MSELRAALAEIAEILAAEQQPWALLGGLAVSAYVEPRFTRDIDLAVAVEDDEAAEALVNELQDQGYGVSMVLEQTSHDRLATVRLVPSGRSGARVVIDLLFAFSGIEAEICRDAETIEVFAELSVPVCRPGHLLALKLLSRDDLTRPQDLIDIRALLAYMAEDELARARLGIQQITERGFHRGRDLTAALERLIEDQAGAN